MVFVERTVHEHAHNHMQLLWMDFTIGDNWKDDNCKHFSFPILARETILSTQQIDWEHLTTLSLYGYSISHAIFITYWKSAIMWEIYIPLLASASFFVSHHIHVLSDFLNRRTKGCIPRQYLDGKPLFCLFITKGGRQRRPLTLLQFCLCKRPM